MNFSSSIMTGMGISLGGLELATDYLYANSDMYEPELTEIKTTISHKPCKPVNRVKPIRPKASTQSIIKKFSIIPEDKQLGNKANTCDEIIEDTPIITVQVEDFDFSFDDIKTKEEINQEQQEENAAMANDLLSRLSILNKQTESEEISMDTEEIDIEDTELAIEDTDNYEDDTDNYEEDTEDEFGLDSLEFEDDPDESEDSSDTIDIDDLGLDDIDYEEDTDEDNSTDIEDEDDDPDGLGIDLEELAALSEKKVQEKVINSQTNESIIEEETKQNGNTEFNIEETEQDDGIEFDIEESTNEIDIEETEQDDDIEFDTDGLYEEDDYGTDDEDSNNEDDGIEFDIEEDEFELPASQPIEKQNNSVSETIKQKIEQVKQVNNTQASQPQISNKQDTSESERKMMERIKQLEAQVQKLSGVQAPVQTSNVMDKDIKKDSNFKTPNSGHLESIMEADKEPISSQQVAKQDNYDRYSAMQVDILYKEVRAYAIQLGVKQKPVEISKLEEKFGPTNIRKLVNKSYIIKIGKGATIGR